MVGVENNPLGWRYAGRALLVLGSLPEHRHADPRLVVGEERLLMGHDRKLQESIDKRSAAVMELERRHRIAVEALETIVQANALTYDMECKFLKRIAREALTQCRGRGGV